jgi:type IV secretory pathway TrbF-like protein
MSKLPTLPVNKTDAEFNAARQLYAEQWGSAVVTNTYLKIALLMVSLVAAGLIYTNIKTVRMVQNFKPLVIRIDSIGRAEAIRYDDLTYTSQEKEIKYFLTEFCRLYYSRNSYTLRDNFRKALLFMDTQLADSTFKAWSNSHVIDDYLSNASTQQDIKVNRVDIEDLRSAPYKATIEYEVIYYSSLDRTELKRAHYTAHFVFSFRDSVGNDLIQINPLGLAISYFREDEALH